MNCVAPRRYTVLVMHPDPLLRAGFVAALGEQATFETFVSGLDDPTLDQPQTDVVITDYASAMSLAGSVHGGLAAVTAARILVITTNDRDAAIRHALKAGIHGYVLLGCPLAELIEGATSVAQGRRYLSPAVAQRIADSLSHTSLTSREIQVLSLLITGASNKAIARELEIETGTVKSHMTAIMSKLGATSRTQAAGIATERGLVEHRAVIRQPSTPRRARALEARAQSS